MCGARSGANKTHTSGAQWVSLRLITRVGTIDVAIPKLRSGTYFPEWLLQRRKTLENALITVVADCCPAEIHTPHGQARQNPPRITGLSGVQFSRGSRPGRTRGLSFAIAPLGDAGLSRSSPAAI